jgi:hypothetical protein
MTMILLLHTGMDSKISTPARLGRELHPPRHYQAEGHILALDGPGHIIAHDADEICKIPGYRLASPAECDAYYAAQRKDSAIHEDVPASEPESPDITDETAPEQANAPQDAEHTTAPTRGKRSK